MQQDRLGLAVASVLGGLAVLMALVAVVYQPFLLVFALPLAGGAYVMWAGATGRMGPGFGLGRNRWRRVDPEEYRRTRADGARTDGARTAGARADGAESRFAGDGPFTRRGFTRGGRAAGRGRGRRGYRTPREPGDPDAPSRREASRVLGVDPDADEEVVRQAYRERVKEVHPDADDGDEEAFRRVTRAYETLTGG